MADCAGWPVRETGDKPRMGNHKKLRPGDGWGTHTPGRLTREKRMKPQTSNPTPTRPGFQAIFASGLPAPWRHLQMVLLETPGLTRAQLSTASGMSARTIRRHTAGMLSAGLLLRAHTSGQRSARFHPVFIGAGHLDQEGGGSPIRTVIEGRPAKLTALPSMTASTADPLVEGRPANLAALEPEKEAPIQYKRTIRSIDSKKEDTCTSAQAGKDESIKPGYLAESQPLAASKRASKRQVVAILALLGVTARAQVAFHGLHLWECVPLSVLQKAADAAAAAPGTGWGKFQLRLQDWLAGDWNPGQQHKRLERHQSAGQLTSEPMPAYTRRFDAPAEQHKGLAILRASVQEDAQ